MNLPRAPRPKLWTLLFVALAAALLRAADPPPFFAEIGKIEAGLAGITGLRFLHPVPYGVLNKDQLRAFLEQRIQKTLKPDDIRACIQHAIDVVAVEDIHLAPTP